MEKINYAQACAKQKISPELDIYDASIFVSGYNAAVVDATNEIEILQEQIEVYKTDVNQWRKVGDQMDDEIHELIDLYTDKKNKLSELQEQLETLSKLSAKQATEIGELTLNRDYWKGLVLPDETDLAPKRCNTCHWFREIDAPCRWCNNDYSQWQPIMNDTPKDAKTPDEKQTKIPCYLKDNTCFNKDGDGNCILPHTECDFAKPTLISRVENLESTSNNTYMRLASTNFTKLTEQIEALKTKLDDAILRQAEENIDLHNKFKTLNTEVHYR